MKYERSCDGVWAGVLAPYVCASCVLAQCEPRWIPGLGLSSQVGLTLRINSLTMWDMDGAGPAAPVLVAGGRFDLPGVSNQINLAQWNGASWTALSANAEVRAVGVGSSGELIVAGHFGVLGSWWTAGQWTNAQYIGRRVGNTWQAMPPAINGIPRTFARHTSGVLLVGGGFSQIGTMTAHKVASWSEAGGWGGLGGGVPGTGYVERILGLTNGDIVVGGQFSMSVGAYSINGIARWNGQAWHAMGPQNFSNGTPFNVYALCELTDGSVIAGGDFTVLSGVAANRIARWDGNNWSALGSGMDSSVLDLQVLGDGRLVAVGTFSTAGGDPAERVAIWDGSMWSGLNSGISQAPHAIRTVTLHPSGEIIVGGTLQTVAGEAVTGWARWSPGNDPWVAVHPSSTAEPQAGGTLELSVTAAAGFSEVSYTWRRNGISLADGPTPHGSVVAGASTAMLSITNVRPEDAGTYDCTIANACGEDTSRPAVVVVGCYANCDGSTATPALNVADFGCFLQRFAAGDAYANCDQSTQPPVLNVADFGCFLEQFAAGCQ